ncbi:hypothetical protein OIU74_022606 [Salix koriyanagi]|uniref:Uncharacterized protein n=1 Tax=Salix koriyanagi TaxID=2511006 RepID=A0A9Q0WNQ5_9ROSI|nr:hypothetical protein OIU74_022606 [Salix koriyanagi]
MAMATQASLFTLTTLKSSNQTIVPWKQSSFLSISNVKAQRSFKVAAAEETATKEAPVGFTPPELDPKHPITNFWWEHWWTAKESSGRGVLCDHMGLPRRSKYLKCQLGVRPS